MRNEPILKLAISLQSNPGVYALLLGSGVSKAANIPTGWDVVLDLIGKLAALELQDPLPDPASWYRETFGEQPEYSQILDRLAATPAERMALLRAYFEPTEEDREKGFKLPTAAHRSIAALVKLGYIRVILTTNFDRLMELALEAEGIVPDIISSEDTLNGAMPIVHSKCLVIKLHGDYRDTRIKNTPEELANYSGELNGLLDRVLNEYGLIVCGWSGTYDTALRNAILRTPTRRFTTFWVARGDVTEEAKQLIDQRRAEVITVEGADKFFVELLGKVESLRDLEQRHPLSTPVAIATTKRYLAEPRYRIQLHDLIQEETERIYRQLTTPQLTLMPKTIEEKGILPLMQEYEILLERLMAMLAALAFYDSDDHGEIFTRVVDRLATIPYTTGSVVLPGLQYYPALLITYAAGIAALAANHYRNLSALLLESSYYEVNRSEKRPAIEKLNVESVFEYLADKIPRPKPNEITPANNYLFERLYPILHDYLPSDLDYAEKFDLFEYVLTLTRLDKMEKSYPLIGRFAWRYTERTVGLGDKWGASPLAKFSRGELASGQNSKLLNAGFFNGSIERFKEIVTMHEDYLNQVSKRWW